MPLSGSLVLFNHRWIIMINICYSVTFFDEWISFRVYISYSCQAPIYWLCLFSSVLHVSWGEKQKYKYERKKKNDDRFCFQTSACWKRKTKTTLPDCTIKSFHSDYMALQLTLSCDSDKSQSGPTLIHSTGVEDYKIPPEVVGYNK